MYEHIFFKAFLYVLTFYVMAEGSEVVIIILLLYRILRLNNIVTKLNVIKTSFTQNSVAQ